MKYKNLTEKVYQILKKDIVNMNIQPGTKIQLDKIAEELEVSKTPVREAVNMLSMDGLVEVKPQSGTYVIELNQKDIKHIYQVRKALEKLAIELSFSKINDENIKALESINNKCLKLYEEEKYEEFVSEDERFHNTIFEITQNKYLITSYNAIRDKLFYLKMAGLVIPKSILESIKAHQKIIKTFKEKDLEKAKHEMKSHVEKVKKHSLKVHNIYNNKRGEKK
ncbi:GntR family transcriptional regulator [Halarsenatibacter silvermanii]|uniref:DNA-binding transcriptional regulator, GntR family n=1 Tax=Halarsenatibacter silvermanii TaxID=321763 RepID=A0A1G9U5G8_9FIRM|nr:GntR family transcriptional regulator [Halarsenatibacter silvermanii]SDM55237.1 DNA-binding transcriptional regulator, GntR family [Halarsenatibacter silvermanii]